ncbi:hypothetical protein F2P44_29680 [Massilia sp. CCM 8695]|uniref:Uncharacterized protein n=1 Tax=Massilia frigida TaxID=2609281 RepID=A0ABX0NJN9_9BURK|nr:hypothetical protein [Massilia frigida]NHZ83405.1 hypothetical protein [Massilia frigida]
MTAKSTRCPLTPVAILDLANAHAKSKAKALYSFSKRDVIAFAEAVAAVTTQTGEDTARLAALSGSSGFVTGRDAGEPAYRMLGTDAWYTDLRTAIDQHPATRRSAFARARHDLQAAYHVLRDH